MRKRILWILGPAFCLVWLSGCIEDGRVAGGTAVGNPPQPGSSTFYLQATSGKPLLPKASANAVRASDSSFSVIDSGGTTFIIREVLANVGYVKLKLPDSVECIKDVETECELEDVKLPGPYIADLMTGKFQPDIGTFRIPPGIYRRVEFRLEGLQQMLPGIDSALFGHSMIIKGTFSYGGKTDRRFTFSLDFDEEIRIESLSGMTVRDQGLNKLILRLEVKKWLSGANITRCLDGEDMALDPEGNLSLDKNNDCGGLEDILDAGVKGSGDLEEQHED